MTDGVKWTHKHKRGCVSVETWPDQPMTLAYAHEEFRDSIGRKLRRGAIGDMWLSIRCNATDCQATALIREDVVLAALAQTKCEVCGQAHPGRGC